MEKPTTAPPPGAFFAHARPPWACAMCWTRDRPMPEPRVGAAVRAPVKALEHAPKRVGGDSGAVITDGDVDGVTLRDELELDGGLTTVLHGVVE